MNTCRRDRMETENAALVEMLGSLNDPVARELADRMRRCRADRIRRREGGFTTVIEVMRAPQYKCKSVACWACRTAHVRRKKEQAARIFSGATNADCSFITINAAEPVIGLDEVAAQHRKFSADLNNLRDALTRRDKRFNRIAGFVVLEVQYDAVNGLWKPHWHVALWHERIDWQEVADVFRRQWQGDRRVNVKPFDEADDAASNAVAITGYALKFHHWDWSVYTAACFWLWLRHRAALRSICVQMNRRVKDSIAYTGMLRHGLKEIEPMPILV
jgi:hypothetical protein